MRRLCCLLTIFFCTACVRTVTDNDVFKPLMAENTTMTITIDDDVKFVDNKPRGGLWEDIGATFEDGAVSADIGAIAYRIMRVSAEDKPLIVFCGGSVFDIPNHGDLAAFKIAPHGDALLWDYPGYGNSEGAPRVEDFRGGVQALSQAINTHRRGSNQKVIFWGHSLGGFVCTELAVAFGTPDALILEATAPSAEAASSHMTPWFMKPFIDIRLSDDIVSFDNVSALKAISTKMENPLPILIMAGGKDRILPASLSEDLRDALKRDGHDVTYHAFPDADHFQIGFQDGHDPLVESFLATLDMQQENRKATP